jgi:secreted trypsin-like serine protease
MKKLIMLMVLCLSIPSTIFAGTIDPDTPDSKYIEYGSKFHNVVKICCFDGKGMSCGSAVVIDSHWIITAAHVVENCHSWSITIDEINYNIVSMISHEKYQSDNFGYDDIALGYIEQPLPLKSFPGLYEDSNEPGKLCSMAGWGFTGNFKTGLKFSDNKRRAGSNFIDKVERNTLVCSPSRRNNKMTELEFLICNGDSGGGLFIDGKLAGIHSSVVATDKKPDSTYNDESCHTRISLYAPWIKQTMREYNHGSNK